MPEPQREDKREIVLRELHRQTGALLALESASKCPRIVIDGDIEIQWPEAVQTEIATRIERTLSELAATIKDLRGE